MVPRIVYWRNASREAEWLTKALCNTDIGGEVTSVDNGTRFIAELEKPSTDLLVLHEESVDEALLKEIQARCPRAGLMLLCNDESKLGKLLRESATHLVSTRRITEALPAMKSALRHSTRIAHALDLDEDQGEEFASILDLVSDAVIVETVDHHIQRWNPAAERLFGWRNSEVQGKRRGDVLVQAEQAVEREASEQLDRVGSWSGEVLYSTVQSRQVDVFTQRRKLFDGDGKLRGWIEVCTDISDMRFGDRKSRLLANLQTLLHTQQQPLDRILDSFVKMAVPLLADTCIIDIKGDDEVIRRVGFASRHPQLASIESALKDELPLFRANHVTVGNVLRGSKTELFRNVENIGAFLGIQEPVIAAAFDGLGPLSVLSVPIISLGRTVGLLTLIASLPNRILEREDSLALQEFAAILGSAVERAHLEERLRTESSQSKAAIVHKDAFLGTISHELRTPLQAMLGWTQLLRDARLSRDAAGKALDSLERSIKAQGQIIGDLLDLSRISAGRLELESRPCELLPIVGAAVRACETQARAKHVNIAPMDFSGPTVWVVADLNWLHRAFYNILSNAVRFSDRGGNIHVSIASDADYARVSIKDTGRGIDADFLPHVFERFTQAETGTTRTHGGLGVGLAIVRHIVESHGGTVQAHSDGANKGSEFVISLPVCPAPERIQTDIQPPFSEHAGGSLHNLRMLLVEDEADTRELLRFVLEQAGGVVTEASSAPDALRCIEQGAYDVLISDIGMPEEDGNSLIRKVRRLPPDKGGSIPALALTAYARAEDRVAALRAGFNVHVCKPVEPSELILLVSELCKRSRAK
jgi:PAS domain S-box-containing protein